MTERFVIVADAREVSAGEFYEAVTGRKLRTKAQREAEWRANCERYADLIEHGSEWAVPPPCVAGARAIVAQRLGIRPATEPNEPAPL